MRDRHPNSVTNGGQLPGLPEERTPTGLVIAIAGVMALVVSRIRLWLSVPVVSRRARSLAWRLRMRDR